MKVLGKYLVSWIPQNNTENYYMLTGNNRHATIKLKNYSDDEFKFTSISMYGYDLLSGSEQEIKEQSRNPLLYVQGNSRIKIIRAMALLNGAEGARPALNAAAANVSLNYTSLYQTTELARIKFILPEYNKWYDLNFELFNSPSYRSMQIGSYFLFSPDEVKKEEIDGEETEVNVEHNFFTIDDFNLQDVYIGEKVYPNLLMEIEAAGMQDDEQRRF